MEKENGSGKSITQTRVRAVLDQGGREPAAHKQMGQVLRVNLKNLVTAVQASKEEELRIWDGSFLCGRGDTRKTI